MVELENSLAQNHSALSIIEQLNLQPGMQVLDAGCGPGRITIPIA
jgi:cyclopropane fatty-acyl-phospholipid synthase-like methyltransferase